MNATIEKVDFGLYNKYIVQKWSNNNEIIETFSTNKKSIATEKFSQFFRDTYNK